MKGYPDRLYWLLPALLAGGILLLLAGCSGAADTTSLPGSTTPVTTMPTTDVLATATADRYRVSEIRDYEGVRLDPAIGPRDNAIRGVQQVSIADYRLAVDGLADNPLILNYEDVLAYPAEQRLITLYCVEGWQATLLWKGVLIENLLEDAQPQTDADTVIFHCADGYTTSLPMSVIRSRQLILAWQANGLPLPPEMGYPFIVVAEDKQGYKWARWVVRIELSADETYQGYWESRGFDNDAELD